MCPSETRDIPKKDVDEWIPVTKNDGPDIQKELARLIGYYHGYDNALKEYYQREPESAGSIFRLEHCIPRVVFVLGRLGSGRTSLALKFCEGSGRKWSYLNCIDTPDSEILSIKQSLLLLHNEIPRETFILVIDEIEALSGGSYLVANLRRKLVLSVLGLVGYISTPDTNCSKHFLPRIKRAFTIVITSDISKLPDSLKPINGNYAIVEMDLMSSKERLKNLITCMRSFLEELPIEDGSVEEFSSILSKKIYRLQRMDVLNLCRNSYINFRIRKAREPKCDGVSLDDLIRASAAMLPAEISYLSSGVPSISMKDLYGLGDIISNLFDTVIKPLLNREEVSKRGLLLPKGILIYGPSGVGKTSLGFAIANELGFASINVDSTRIRSKVIGQSEKNIASIFSTASSYSPCTLILDNIDSLVPIRGSDCTSENTSERTVASFLTEIDGILTNRSADKHVFIIATSSNPKMIDPAMLRAGRIGDHIPLFTPNASVCVKARIDIFKGFMRNAPHSLSSEDWEKISHATENFTGADIKRTCSSAIVSACIKRGDSECGISLKDILDSVNDLKCVG